MNAKRCAATLIAAAWIHLLAMPAVACRYSVRDTGFVDLGEQPYQLVLSGRDGTGSDLYQRLAATSLPDANISFVHREARDAGARALVLHDSGGRTLELARGDSVALTTPGATALLEAAAASPTRAEIQETALRSMAVVVLVEGSNAAENARAAAAVEEAIREVARTMPFLPKPAGAPPALLRITPDQLARERVTVWGLGFDPAPSAEPRVAIVFGRGRRLGSPLEGLSITRTAVEERLTIIGQDCECDLDRAWMKGPLLPVRWDATRQQQAAQALGFDPENPLVRTEVSRIVLRGPEAGQPKASRRAASSLGYSEEVLEELPANPAQAAHVASASIPAAPPAQARSPGRAVEPPPAGGLERTRAISWTVLVGSGAGVLVFAAWWWLRIRREQG